MKERGKYQIQFMKTRSSSGVGQKVDLDFNIETLRITDPGEDEQEGSLAEKKSAGSVYQGLKRVSTVTSVDHETGEIKEVDPTRGVPVSKSKHAKGVADIRSLLANLNPEQD
jgi:hypothetical protein